MQMSNNLAPTCILYTSAAAEPMHAWICYRFLSVRRLHIGILKITARLLEFRWYNRIGPLS